jgi:Tfp pilus assembly protein PilF
MRTWRGRDRARGGGDPRALWAEARMDLDLAVERLPHYPDMVISRGQLELAISLHLAASDRRAGAGELGQAAADFDVALAAEPDNAVALAGRAQVRWQRGDVAGARADFERVRAVRPWLAVPLAQEVPGLARGQAAP